MQRNYECPKLIIIGEANQVVMGLGSHGTDGVGQLGAPDFEFEQD